MSTLWKVIRKSDGVEVSRYEAISPVIREGFELDTHDHIQIVEPPPGPILPEKPWKITKLAFRNRFTRAEKASLEMAALDNPSANIQQRQLAAALRVDMEDQAQATYIDLDRPDTRAGVQQLESLGLLGSGRALIILDTPPTEVEIYRG